MKFLLCAFLCFTGAYGAVLLGSNKCTWGPAYWCDTLEKAKGCGSGAVDHCVENVWGSDGRPKRSLELSKVLLNTEGSWKDEQCDLCTNVTIALQKALDNNGTQAQLKKIVEGLCQSAGVDCSEILDQYMPMIIKFLDTELPNLCAVIGLCPSTGFEQSLEERVIEAMIKSGLTTEIKKLSQAINQGDGQYCDTCEEVFGYIKIFMDNNATMLEMEDLLINDICPQLGSFSDMCKGVVTEYLPNIWSSLLTQLDPAKVCHELKLCNSTVNSTFSAAKLTPAAVKPRGNSLECTLCEFLIREVDSLILKNATEEEIEKALATVCNIFPASDRSQCDSVVDQYGPMIIKLLVNAADPSLVCGYLGLCTSTPETHKLPVVQGPELCDACTAFMTYAESQLENNATEIEIVKTLVNACTEFLSGDMARKCSSMVEQNGPSIMKMLANQLNPKEVCATLGMCASTLKADGRVHLYKKN